MSRPASHAPFALSQGLVATLTLLALAGCAVGPDYKRPEATLPEAYVATAEAAPAAQAPVEKEWWKLFQDATLNDLVRQAQEHNHDLLLAVAQVEEAEGVAREAGAAFFPQIDANASGGRNEISMKTDPLPAANT